MIFSIQNLFVVTVILSALTFVLFVHAFFLRKKINKIFTGESGMRLDRMIESHLARIRQLEQEIKRHEEELIRVTKDAGRAFQKIEMLRFNSFEEAGGQQSWTIALLDGNQNGLIVTSLQLRDAARLYVKEIHHAIASNKLSNEEEITLKKALQK